jgi:hypothetical protein
MNDVGVGEEVEFGFRTPPRRFGNSLIQCPQLARPAGRQRLAGYDRRAASIALARHQGSRPRPRRVRAAVIDENDRQRAGIVLGQQAVQHCNDRLFLVPRWHDRCHRRPLVHRSIDRLGQSLRTAPEAAVEKQQVEPSRRRKGRRTIQPSHRPDRPTAARCGVEENCMPSRRRVRVGGQPMLGTMPPQALLRMRPPTWRLRPSPWPGSRPPSARRGGRDGRRCPRP